MYRDALFDRFCAVFKINQTLKKMRVFSPYENTDDEKTTVCAGIALNNETEIDRGSYLSMDGLVEIESNFDYDNDKSMLGAACEAFESLLKTPSNFNFGSSMVDDIIIESISENMVVEGRNARLYTLKIMITK